MLDTPPRSPPKLLIWQPPEKNEGKKDMPLQTIRVERVYPSGMLRLSGLQESRLFMGYTLREAKRVYREEFNKLNGRDVFTNAKGQLTAYAFACGYVERHGEYRLYKNGCFHVQRSNNEWHTFSTLTEARKVARRLSRGAN